MIVKYACRFTDTPIKTYLLLIKTNKSACLLLSFRICYLLNYLVLCMIYPCMQYYSIMLLQSYMSIWGGCESALVFNVWCYCNHICQVWEGGNLPLYLIMFLPSCMTATRGWEWFDRQAFNTISARLPLPSVDLNLHSDSSNSIYSFI